MRYYVDIDRLKDDGEELIHYAQNNIGTKYDELLALLNNFMWEGKARDTFDRKYKKMIGKVKNIEETIVKLGIFMVTCSENYNETEDVIIAKWQEKVDEYINDLTE